MWTKTSCLFNVDDDEKCSGQIYGWWWWSEQCCVMSLVSNNRPSSLYCGHHLPWMITRLNIKLPFEWSMRANLKNKLTNSFMKNRLESKHKMLKIIIIHYDRHKDISPECIPHERHERLDLIQNVLWVCGWSIQFILCHCVRYVNGKVWDTSNTVAY